MSWHIEGKNMDRGNHLNIELLQGFPMKMNVFQSEENQETGTFMVKFSSGDFMREGQTFVPVSFFMEALGQAAELYYQASGDMSKRYLTNVDQFRFSTEIYEIMESNFEIHVKIIQKLGKLYKSHIAMSFDGKVFCEGDYVHCNA